MTSLDQMIAIEIDEGRHPAAMLVLEILDPAAAARQRGRGSA